MPRAARVFPPRLNSQAARRCSVTVTTLLSRIASFAARTGCRVAFIVRMPTRTNAVVRFESTPGTAKLLFNEDDENASGSDDPDATSSRESVPSPVWWTVEDATWLQMAKWADVRHRIVAGETSTPAVATNCAVVAKLLEVGALRLNTPAPEEAKLYERYVDALGKGRYDFVAKAIVESIIEPRLVAMAAVKRMVGKISGCFPSYAHSDDDNDTSDVDDDGDADDDDENEYDDGSNLLPSPEKVAKPSRKRGRPRKQQQNSVELPEVLPVETTVQEEVVVTPSVTVLPSDPIKKKVKSAKLPKAKRARKAMPEVTSSVSDDLLPEVVLMPKSHQRVVDTTAMATPSHLDPKPTLDVEADANVDAVEAASTDSRRWRLNDFYDYSNDEMDASVLEAVLKRPSSSLPETSSHDVQGAYPPRRKRANLIESDAEIVAGQVIGLNGLRSRGARAGERGERDDGVADRRSQFSEATDAHRLSPQARASGG